MTHYHILDGSQGGYLPDENEVYRTELSAIGALRSRVLAYHAEGMKTTGGVVSRLVAVDDGTRLGRVLSLAPCTGADCLDEARE